MSKERIAGIMMGISVGVAIGYYLTPRKNAGAADSIAGSSLKSEPATSRPVLGPGSQAKSAAAR